MNAKSYGIQRLQGQSFSQILGRDLRQLATHCTVTTISVSATTIALLYLYNRLNQFATFAWLALSFTGTYVIAAISAHIATLALVHRDAVINAVKGEVTATWAMVGSYLLRIAAIALVFSVGNSAMVSGLVLKEDRQKNRTWAEIGNAYYLRISGAVQDDQNGETIDNAIGQWIRDADSRDEVSIAWRHRPDSGISGTGGRDVLVVNNKYLVNQQIYDVTGTLVRSSDEPTIRVLVPQRYAQDQTRLSIGISEWAKSQARRAHHGEPPAVRLEQTRNYQSVLSYARSFSDGEATLTDPIIVVVTGASGVIPNDEYTSIASRGELLIEDPDRAMRELASAGVDTYVLGMSPFAQEAADKYRKVQREFALQVFNLAATVAVLLITAVALSIVYSRRNSQVLFVKYVLGWGFLRTHRWILSSEVGLALAFSAWTWYSTTAAINSYKLPGAPPPPPGVLPLEDWEPALASGVAVLSLALFALALLRTNASFIKEHSASL